jgi:hypothetical protein
MKFKVPLSCHIAESNACGQHVSCSLWRQHPHDKYILLVCIRFVEKTPSSQALVLTVKLSSHARIWVLTCWHWCDKYHLLQQSQLSYVYIVWFIFMFFNFSWLYSHNNTCVALAIYIEAPTKIGLNIRSPQI